MVPLSLRSKVLTEAPCGITSGHFGQSRTLNRLRMHYYWPGMSVDVNVFCKQCSTCAQSKDPPRKPKAPLGTIRAGAPFSVVAMDIMGPFPVTSLGHKYILVVGDYFSKWLELIPLSNMTAECVASRLVEIVVSRFGVPHVLHTDQGANFESRLMASLCKSLGIHKTRTTPYHPQSDGLIERANKTIQIALRSYVERDQSSWDKWLPMVQLAYNCSVQ